MGQTRTTVLKPHIEVNLNTRWFKIIIKKLARPRRSVSKIKSNSKRREKNEGSLGPSLPRFFTPPLLSRCLPGTSFSNISSLMDRSTIIFQLNVQLCFTTLRGGFDV